MRAKLAVLMALVGAVLVALGVAQMTVWAPQERFTATADLGAKPAPVVLVPPSLYEFKEGPVEVRVEGPGVVNLAIAPESDLKAWIGPAAHTTVGAVAQEGTLSTTFTDGEKTVPNPAGADTWASDTTGEKKVSTTWKLPPSAPWGLLIASDGTAPAPTKLTLTWENDESRPWAWPAVGAGAVLLLGALALLLLTRGRKAPAGGRRDATKSIPASRSAGARTGSTASGAARKSTGSASQAAPDASEAPRTAESVASAVPARMDPDGKAAGASDPVLVGQDGYVPRRLQRQQEARAGSAAAGLVNSPHMGGGKRPDAAAPAPSPVDDAASDGRGGFHTGHPAALAGLMPTGSTPTVVPPPAGTDANRQDGAADAPAAGQGFTSRRALRAQREREQAERNGKGLRSPMLAGALASLIALNGIQAGQTTPQPSADNGVRLNYSTAVVPEQLERILGEVADAAQSADSAKDTAALATRFAGPAEQMRAANYAVRGKYEAHKPPVTIGSASVMAQVVGKAGEPWPRRMVVVSKADDQLVPQALVLQQNSARENYKVTHTAQLLPGTSFPQPLDLNYAAEPLAPDAPGFTMTPQEALAGYADVLTNNGGGPFAASFQPSSFTDEIKKFQETTTQNLQAANGQAVFRHEVDPNQTVAFKTSNGGALVFGYVRQAIGLTPDQGTGLAGEVSLPKDWAAVAGQEKSTTGVDATYGEFVALHVSPAASNTPVAVQGAEQDLLSVALRP